MRDRIIYLRVRMLVAVGLAPLAYLTAYAISALTGLPDSWNGPLGLGVGFVLIVLSHVIACRVLDQEAAS